MAVKRQGNWLGQQRVDVPHIRAIEAGVAGDFDALAGKAMAGQQALVVTGFTLSNVTAGQPVSNLLLNVAGGVLLHATASESGTIFTVPALTNPETFLSSNPKLAGSFAPGTTNYVGLDLVRAADPTTTDVVRFLSAATEQEYTQTVPLARTLDYSIVIVTSDFNSNPNLVPIAKVVTDAANSIVSVVDCRQMMFRLGTGGTTPAPRGTYPWDDTSRNEALSADPFSGGDKSISSQWNWGRAVMSRLWELGGGEYWYSPSADRNVKVSGNPAQLFGGGENFEWTGGNLHWQGVRFSFANSTGWYNEVAPVTVNTPGLTDLAVGECIYVDIDRTQNTTVSAVKGVIASLGLPTIPGSRYMLAWRPFSGDGSNYVFSILNGGQAPVGTSAGGHANAGDVYGTVTLLSTGGLDAKVPSVESGGAVVAAGVTRYGSAPTGLGAGTLNFGTVAGYDTRLIFGNATSTALMNGASTGTFALLTISDVASGATNQATLHINAPNKTGTGAILTVGSSVGVILTLLANGTLRVNTIQGMDTVGVNFNSKRAAADASTDFLFDTAVTRTNGKLFSFKNLTTELLSLSSTGNLSLKADKSQVISNLHDPIDANDAATRGYVDAVGGQVPPPGSITMFAGGAEPTGWKFCNGQSLVRADYPDLFAAIGITYGAVDGTHFSLPDLRSRAVVGVYTAPGGNVPALGNDDRSSPLSIRTLASKGGREAHDLAMEEMPAHRHYMSYYTDGSGLPDTGQDTGSDKSAPTSYAGGVGTTWDSPGPTQAHVNMQPWIALNFIIKT